jgi:hypothetical protein
MPQSDGVPDAQPPERSPVPEQSPAPVRSPASPTPEVRSSDQERDAVVERLQVAFAQGRLDDEEFDGRVRAALVTRTRSELDELVADLPAEQRTGAAVPASPPGRNVVAFKGSVRRRGRWRVPERTRALSYKSTCELDLRAAELPGPVTEFTTVVYKSDVRVIVPPGVRVEFRVFGYGGDFSDPELSEELPADAPVVRVRGFAYKARIHASTRPQADPDR